MQDVCPFSVTGVDFTGALYIHYRGEETKVYVCLFTCATSRAIHLEVVADLSTETFLLAFRRFAGHRSTPQLMISDNATIFQSAAEELKTLFIRGSESSVKPGRSYLEVHTKEGSMVWRLLGAPNRPHKVCDQESTWQSPHHPGGATDNCSGSVREHRMPPARATSLTTSRN